MFRFLMHGFLTIYVRYFLLISMQIGVLCLMFFFMVVVALEECLSVL